MKLFKQTMPLNSLEKFMLSHESEYVSYNSQICIEFKGEIDQEILLNAIDKFIKEIPLLRTYVKKGFFNFHRYVKSQNNLDSNNFLIIKKQIINQNDIDQFSKKKFDLEIGLNFCILVAPISLEKNIFIFNVHHSLCDAAGQFLLLEEFFRLLNGQEVRAEAKSTKVFRYRHLTKYLGLQWVLQNIKEQFQTLSNQRNYKMATLIDNLNENNRLVSSKTIYFTKDEQEQILKECRLQDISITEYITANSFKAMDAVLKEKNDFNTPIMVYLPKTLRPYLKIRYSFQNILSTVVIVGKRNEIFDINFSKKIKHIINNHKMDKAAKFIYSTLLMTALTPVKKLQSFYQKLDQDPNSITSSLLISAGRVPRSFNFPENWENPTVWARGTMLKSPGVGVIYTGVPGSETLTIEYLKNCTNENTIKSFQKHLILNLIPIYSSLPKAKVGYEIPVNTPIDVNKEFLSV